MGSTHPRAPARRPGHAPIHPPGRRSQPGPGGKKAPPPRPRPGAPPPAASRARRRGRGAGRGAGPPPTPTSGAHPCAGRERGRGLMAGKRERLGCTGVRPSTVGGGERVPDLDLARSGQPTAPENEVVSHLRALPVLIGGKVGSQEEGLDQAKDQASQEEVHGPGRGWGPAALHSGGDMLGRFKRRRGRHAPSMLDVRGVGPMKVSTPPSIAGPLATASCHWLLARKLDHFLLRVLRPRDCRGFPASHR